MRVITDDDLGEIVGAYGAMDSGAIPLLGLLARELLAAREAVRAAKDHMAGSRLCNRCQPGMVDRVDTDCVLIDALDTYDRTVGES